MPYSVGISSEPWSSCDRSRRCNESKRRGISATAYGSDRARAARWRASAHRSTPADAAPGAPSQGVWQGRRSCATRARPLRHTVLMDGPRQHTGSRAPPRPHERQAQHSKARRAVRHPGRAAEGACALTTRLTNSVRLTNSRRGLPVQIVQRDLVHVGVCH
eukprot:COSAG01_NODE_2966_length_6790_cov_15.092662_8_plen_161_part_00